jgi:PAS domain S-box-containing protein
MKIRSHLLWLTVVGFGGFLIFAALALTTLFRVEINGPVYRQIFLSKDLITDYVAPPLNLLQAELICTLMSESRDPAEVERELRFFEAAQRDYDKTYADYMQRVPEGKLKEMMRGTAQRTAQQYFRIAQQAFLPLVRQGDGKRARAVLAGQMKPLYEQHAAAVDEIVAVAKYEAKHGENLAAQLARSYTRLMIGGGLLILVAGGVFASAIARGVSKQTEELVRSGQALREEISRQKQMIEALRQSEDRFSKSFRSSPIPMAIAKLGGGIVDLNDALLQKLDLTREEVLGRTADEVGVSVEPAAKLREEFRNNGMKLRNRETQYRNRSGQVLTMLISVELIQLEGEPHMLWMGPDITEQKSHEDLMRMLGSAVATASDAIIITDSDLNPAPTVTYANPAFTRLTGYTTEELVGRKTSATFGARMDSRSLAEIQQVLSTGNAFHGEVTNYTKDGRLLYLELDISPVRDSAGKTTHFVAVRRDISHRKIEELNRQRLLRLVFEAQTEERRRIARELHDHAGQLLTSMLLRLNVLQEAAPNPAVKRAVREISSVASNALEDLSRLARGLHPAVLEDLGLTVALRRAVEEFADTGIAATFDVIGGTERLPQHIEHEIYQIVKEALTNVQKHSRASQVRVLLKKHATSASATVIDDGVGFDPRQPPTGRHLGIVGMRERAMMLEGSLQVASTPGEGTTVVLTLPLAQTQQEHA